MINEWITVSIISLAAEYGWGEEVLLLEQETWALNFQ
jgi:hypothetical protein